MEKRPPKLREILALSFLGFLLFPAVPVCAQDPPATIASSALRSDVAVLRRAYETMHPGLERYNSKAQLDRHFADLDAAFARERTLRDAYLELSRFLAKIRCGHTYANFFNQPKSVADALFKGKDRVPFYFRWIDRRMIVTRSFTEHASIRPGIEIVAIDGVPVARILGQLMTLARADGSNDAKRVSSLEVTGDSRYESFDIYFPMLFPQQGESRTYSVRAAGTRRPVSLRLDSLSFEDRVAALAVEAGDAKTKDAPIWRLEFLEDGTAYLRMRTWALFNSKWDWKSFLGASMDELSRRATPNLIIDLRGNEGGLDCGDLIVSRLIDADLSPGQYRRLVRYRSAPEDLLPYLDTWDPSFRNWGTDATGPEDGFYRLKGEDGDVRGRVIAAKGPRYRGAVYLLIDAANSSATFQFAEVLKRNRLATLVGQPTGGNQRGINGGAFFFLRLPNSKIEVDLPLIGSFPTSSMPDAGIAPDVAVSPSQRDIANGVDTELAVVRKLIAKGRQRSGRPFNSAA